MDKGVSAGLGTGILKLNVMGTLNETGDSGFTGCWSNSPILVPLYDDLDLIHLFSFFRLLASAERIPE